MNNTQDRELDWDDEIGNDGEDFILLPEGEYDFIVSDLERGRFPGGATVGSCNKVHLNLTISSESGKCNVKEDLLLHSRTEWKVCSFFVSIGQRVKGEKLKMNWSKVTGSKGRCQIGIREYTKDGKIHQINSLNKFLPPFETTSVSKSESVKDTGQF
jgi:hypothetical protein